MKSKNIIQLVALTICAMPLSVSLNSCTDEDIIDNYATILHDSTYFTYDVEDFVGDMWGANILNIFTYEVTGDLTHNLKHLTLQPQDGRYYWVPEDRESDITNKDSIKTFYIDEALTQRLYYGAGFFRSVAVMSRINPADYYIDESEVMNAMKYPSYDVLKSASYKYITRSFEDMFRYAYEVASEQQAPYWGWEDKNLYKNADGTEALYVYQGIDPVFGGVSYDTLKVGEHKTIHFDKIAVSHKYNVDLKFSKDENLNNYEVESIYGLFSGVPLSMRFYDETMDVENTGKISFRLHPAMEDTPSNKTIEATREMNMIGFSYGNDTIATSTLEGPGVLQLIVRGKWESSTVNMYVLCNISKSIIDAGVIKKTEKGWIWGGNTELPIHISTKITAEMLDKARAGETIVWKD